MPDTPFNGYAESKRLKRIRQEQFAILDSKATPTRKQSQKTSKRAGQRTSKRTRTSKYNDLTINQLVTKIDTILASGIVWRGKVLYDLPADVAGYLQTYGPTRERLVHVLRKLKRRIYKPDKFARDNATGRYVLQVHNDSGKAYHQYLAKENRAIHEYLYRKRQRIARKKAESREYYRLRKSGGKVVG